MEKRPELASLSTAPRPRARVMIRQCCLSVAFGAALAGMMWPAWWVVATPAAGTALLLDLLSRTPRDRAPELAAACDRAARRLRAAVGLKPPAAATTDAIDPAALLDSASISASDAISRVRQAHAQAREVIDSVGDPLLATDAQGVVRLSNKAAGAFFGRESIRLLGRRFDELFTSAEVLSMHAAAVGGMERQAYVRLPREAGMRTYEVSAVPIPWRIGPGASAGEEHDGGARAGDPAPSDTAADPDFRGSLVTLRDVTDLATAVQLKTDFVANASHELRTPLSSIRAAVETLTEDPDDGFMRARLLRMIVSNVSRLEELTRDLLDLSRLESPDAAPTIVPMQASEIAESLSAFFEGICAERKLTLHFDLDPALERLRSDPKLLDLILRNLIENSAKFAYEGSVIQIVGRAEPSPANDDATPPPSAPANRDDTSLVDATFSVIDSGQGIPLSSQPRIFERFYQVDQSRSGLAQRRGTGLGLAIVKHAVRSLGGTIRVESVWKQGTTMTFVLPRCVEIDRKAADAA